MPTYLPIQDGCKFLAYGGTRYVLHTPDDRHFLVSSTTKEILEALREGEPLENICASLSGPHDGDVSADELRQVLEKRYAHLGIFPTAADRGTAARPGAPATWAFLRCWDLVPDGWVLSAAERLSWMYRAIPAFLILATIIAAHALVYSKGLAAFHPRLPHGSPLLILFLALFSILAHEIGHATALFRFGAKPGKIGFGLYLLMPTFFADVSQVWRLPRHARFVVDLGGVFFQQAVFTVFAACAWLWRSFEFAAACSAIDAMTLLALNPVFRFDGYWLLADWLGLPKLHQDALLLLKVWGGRLIRGRSGSPSRKMPIAELTGVQKAAFVIYALFCNLFLAFAVVLSVRYLRSSVFGLFRYVQVQVSQILFSASAGDWATLIDQAVTLVVTSAFAATAFWGIGLYSIRILRAAWHSLANLALRNQTKITSAGV
jgi:putative peptide zinc metalloprotease protein